MKYYKIEWRKYYVAYKVVFNTIGEKGNICDCGGFLGVFALVMAEIGYDVCIIEDLKYYGNEL